MHKSHFSLWYERMAGMGLIEIILTGIGLAMDAFAVSITNGVTVNILSVATAIKICGAYGLFQAMMPVLGWLIGINFEKYVNTFDHWIAFGVLSFIGINMILESRKKDDTVCLPENIRKESLSNGKLLALAIATSIDAFSVGVSFAFLQVSIFKPVIIIGLITFAICMIGIEVGKRCLMVFKSRAEILGGVILIIIGLKILVEHLGLITFA